MNKKSRYLVLCVLVIVAMGVWALMVQSAGAAGNYYVDCSAASNGNGTQASPWNTLTTVNATTFAAGDQILFKRGSTCTGQLWPKGSGVSGSPITVSAYGSGARPVIDGNNAVAPVVTIKDQNYWTIDSLEIKNSTGLGLYVDGTTGADLYGFTLTNLYVHNGGMVDGQHLILVGNYQQHSVHDVLIDSVEASYGWRGIEIGGKCCNDPVNRNTNVTIRNSNVHHVQSDGILLAGTRDGVAEYNVVYETGLMTTLQNHTPNGLWTWDCKNCDVRFNEVYTSHSPSWDGGAFDIDYFNDDNIVQYNYAHDNDAYCVAVFGGDSGDVTVNSIVRYNICSNNVRDGSYAANRNGDIYMSVWSRGSVQDTYIYNNTIYYNPAGAYHAFHIVNMRGKAINNTNFYNNIIYSASPNLVNLEAFNTQTHLDNNIYWYTGAGSPSFKLGGSSYTSFAAWKTGSGQDAHSLYTDPMLNNPTYHGLGMPVSPFTLQAGSPAINAGANLVALGLQTSMGSRDFFGNAIPNGAYDIGAHEFGGVPAPTYTPTAGPSPTPSNTPTVGPSPTPTNTPTQTPTIVPTVTPGGSNLALNKPVTAYMQHPSFPATNAVDGNVSTYYKPGKDTARIFNWIRVDLQTNYAIGQVTLKWNSAGRYATAYSIQVSTDGTNWTTVYTTTSGAGGTETINFSTVTARYVRLYSTAWTNLNEGDYINEFEVR